MCECTGRVELLVDMIMTRGGSTPGTPNRSLQRVLGAAGVAIAVALAIAGCGGTTGNDTTAYATTGSDLPFVFGAFATLLEEPRDGAVDAALESAAADGLIKYEHLDNLRTADEMERALRDIIASEGPDIIMGEASAAEEAVRAVAADFPDTAFACGSGGAEQAPNSSVFDDWMQDPAYPAGVLAGGLTKTDTIGVIAARRIPEVNRIVNAFIAGVEETNAGATVTVSLMHTLSA